MSVKKVEAKVSVTLSFKQSEYNKIFKLAKGVPISRWIKEFVVEKI